MPLSPGTRIGPYEVTAKIGEGGMGEVYRATDTKLKRQVALKILPAAVATASDRLARFQREAEVLASLNHPHIAQIYGLEEADSTKALVMELVEGPTLADRVAAGLPIAEALAIARQIAEALEAAHDQGIVHRDLKPANIKVRDDGTVKVLDFGLAKALEPGDGTSANLSNSPTITATPTQAGVILGTAGYMSPEQARGRPVDKRADIWAFGCVLYEMLTGQRTFPGDNVTDTIAAVVRADPDWSALPAGTPANVRRVLRRCLEKDRRLRLADIADARWELDNGSPEELTALATDAPPQRTRARERIAWVALAVVAAIVSGLGVRSWLRVPPAEEVRLQMPAGLGNLTAFAISPDGQRMVFGAAGDGESRLWLRPVGTEEEQPLKGTEGAEFASPFWSPDSRSIGFFAKGKLKRLDLDTGVVRELPNAIGVGGAWSQNGTILYASSFTGPLFRIPADGSGVPSEVTRLESPITGHQFPAFLPDGMHFIFFAYGSRAKRGVYVGSLDSKKTELVLSTDATAVLAGPDHLLFERGGTLLTQRLDLRTLKPTGTPVPVTQRVAVDSDISRLAVSASAQRTIAYRDDLPERELVWIDRSSGTASGRIDGATPVVNGIRLSPNGRAVAFIQAVNNKRDIWVVDAAGGVPRQLTATPDWEGGLVWLPNNSGLLFSTDPKGPADLYSLSVTTGGAASVLLETPEDKIAQDISVDGKSILFVANAGETARDIRAFTFADRRVQPIVQGPSEERNARFSPDGQWIAYTSSEGGRDDVYVKQYPSGSLSKVTDKGGTDPRWNPQGGELFYLSSDDRVTAIPIRFSGSSISKGTPVPLFNLPPGSDYEPADQGRRFLVSRFVSNSLPISMILNCRPCGE